MYKTGNSCPTCIKGKLSEQIITEDFEYKGKTFSISNYYIFRCDKCMEEFVDPKSIRKTEKILTDIRRGVDGLLLSKEIKVIRNKLGMTQKELASKLEVAEKTFARYENGQVVQSKAMDILLRILDNSPSVLNEIDKQVKFDFEIDLPPIPCCQESYPTITYAVETEKYINTELGIAA